MVLKHLPTNDNIANIICCGGCHGNPKLYRNVRFLYPMIMANSCANSVVHPVGCHRNLVSAQESHFNTPTCYRGGSKEYYQCVLQYQHVVIVDMYKPYLHMIPSKIGNREFR